jgi:predicted patatin/cPLA2 family phospholipase
LHGEKEDFVEYFLNLEYAKFTFPILKNYLAKKYQSYPRTLKKEKNLKNKTQIFSKKSSNFIFLHGEKEDFEK